QLRRAVRHTLLISALAGTSSLPVFAQDTEIEQIVVTGSRIKMANLEGTSPVTQVTNADIATQGVTRVEDLINQLPQAFAAQNATVANGATGTATVSLRGLGSARTLVLIDGRRMPYGGVTNSAADLNQIPAAMVERVEILTGGASAVYGSDAIGGVVNFIMKKDFEGVQFDAQYGFYQHNNSFEGDGAVKLRDVIAGRAATNPTGFRLPGNYVTDGGGTEFNVLMGVNTEDGRGNLTAYAGVRDNDEVLQRDRDYSACSLSATRNTDLSHRCGGSATSYPGYFYTAGSAFTIDQTTGNTFRPFDPSTDQYNFGPSNHYQRPDRRYSLGAMGHYELTEHADVYTQLMFTDYKSIAQIAPGGNFFNSNTVNCGNPFLSQQQLDTLGCDAAAVAANDSVTLYVARRNVEGGGRQQAFENSSFRSLLGVRGAITDAWDYDASVQYSKVKADQLTKNYFQVDRIQRSINVVADPTTGAPVCESALDGTDPLCAPYNIFQIGGVTQAALDYLQVPGLQQGTIDQTIYQGIITGDLASIGGKSPWASEGIQLAFGAEYRKDRLNNQTDALLTSGNLSGLGGPTISIKGETSVTDLFTEVRIPIADGMTFADSLTVDAAYRYSDYDKLTTDTYKVGMDWAPIQDVKFRGSYQKAVRAANVVELFTAQGFNLFDLPGDPCGADLAGSASAASDAACLATGVPASQLRAGQLDSPAGQYNFLQGGNPDLVPEESETVTFGVILQPRFLPKLAMSIDYFDIEITDTISTFGSDNTLNACYFQGDADSCARINRDQNGNLWRGSGFVQDLNVNIGSLQTSGIDVSLNYSGVEMGSWGSLNFNLTGTYLNELITVPGPGVDEYDCAGLYSGSCGTPNPEWRHHARLGWVTPWAVDLSLTWRYYDGVEEFRGSKQQIDYELDAANYFDLAANWSITEKFSVLVGVNNVMDSDPPVTSAVGTTGNGNTFPQTYDALGRWIFVRAQVGF
ncbi:MAG: TonB-dependent receptor, partial [Steroidobacteraceae bacterium]